MTAFECHLHQACCRLRALGFSRHGRRTSALQLAGAPRSDSSPILPRHFGRLFNAAAPAVGAEPARWTEATVRQPPSRDRCRVFVGRALSVAQHCSGVVALRAASASASRAASFLLAAARGETALGRDQLHRLKVFFDSSSSFGRAPRRSWRTGCSCRKSRARVDSSPRRRARSAFVSIAARWSVVRGSSVPLWAANEARTATAPTREVVRAR